MNLTAKETLLNIIPKIIETLSHHEMIYKIDLGIGFNSINMELGLIQKGDGKTSFDIDRLLYPFKLNITLKPSSPLFEKELHLPMEKYNVDEINEDIKKDLLKISKNFEYCPLHVEIEQSHIELYQDHKGTETKYIDRYIVCINKQNAESTDIINRYQKYGRSIVDEQG